MGEAVSFATGRGADIANRIQVIEHLLRGQRDAAIRDFKDTVYPLFDADTLFLECYVCVCVCVCVCVYVCVYLVLSCLAILRIEGCLNSAP